MGLTRGGWGGEGECHCEHRNLTKNNSLFIIGNVDVKCARGLSWNGNPVSGTSHQAFAVDGAKSELTTHRETAAIPLPVCAEAKIFMGRRERYQVLNISPGQGGTGGRGGGERSASMA